VAWLASMPDEEDPGLMPGEEPDPEDPPPPSPARRPRSPRPGQGSRAPAGVPRGVPSARRGPGEPGSARRVPGESPGPAGAFATGQPLDVAPGCAALHGLAEHVAGTGDRFAGASDDELIGVLCALDRAGASAAALKHAAVAELIRRRPGPGAALAGPGQMPLVWEEFTEAELTDALAETRCQAEAMLSLAHDLETRLPAAAGRRPRTRPARTSRRRAACSRPGSPAASTSPSPCPPCWAWRSGPASSPAWAPSTRPWPAPPPGTPRPATASPSPMSRDTPSATAAPDQHPASRS
jgi:hypothetical protein